MSESTLGITITMPGPLCMAATAVHVTARLAYVLYIGLQLRQAERNPASDHAEQYARWQRFKRRAAFILNADGFTSALIIATSMNSLAGLENASFLRWGGVVLAAVGIAIKMSAYRVIGEKGYYWFNFFCTGKERSYVKRGIYRYLDNPMYGLGYLHAFGFPLIFLSFWGLASALFDLIAVWVFYFLFERPHTLRHTQQGHARAIAPST